MYWIYTETDQNKIRNLAKAGALIAAEIDRLQREKENYANVNNTV